MFEEHRHAASVCVPAARPSTPDKLDRPLSLPVRPQHRSREPAIFLPEAQVPSPEGARLDALLSSLSSCAVTITGGKKP